MEFCCHAFLDGRKYLTTAHCAKYVKLPKAMLSHSILRQKSQVFVLLVYGKHNPLEMCTFFDAERAHHIPL